MAAYDFKRKGTQAQMYDGSGYLNMMPLPNSVWWYSDDDATVYIKYTNTLDDKVAAIQIAFTDITFNGVAPINAADADTKFGLVFQKI